MSMAGRGGRRATRGDGRGGWIDTEDPHIPLCKDYLNGTCWRPAGGCKFRHGEDPRRSFHGGGAAMGGRAAGGVPMVRGRLTASAYYDEGSEAKRTGGDGAERLAAPTAHEDYYGEYANPPPPPPPQPSPTMAAERSEGFGTSMKALEDENFMLKRWIEELKKQVSDIVATVEYMLTQNATLPLSTMNSVVKQEAPPGTSNVTYSQDLNSTARSDRGETLEAIRDLYPPTPTLVATAKTVLRGTLPRKCSSRISNITSIPDLKALWRRIGDTMEAICDLYPLTPVATAHAEAVLQKKLGSSLIANVGTLPDLDNTMGNECGDSKRNLFPPTHVAKIGGDFPEARSDSQEFQQIMKQCQEKEKQFGEKELKEENYFGSEKLRDGKERTVEAPIISATHGANPIIILGTQNKENGLAQRHTGEMSKSFNTAIIRRRIASRVATTSTILKK